MKELRPFFSYYGGKWRIAKRYPAPKHDTIIEPFAGSAGYSLRYPHKNVILVEKYHVLAAIWDYLIHVSEEEILSLPLLGHGDDISDLAVCQEAKWLIGFCINQATASPCCKNTRAHSSFGPPPESSAWWSEARKQRIASQLRAIRHWRIINGEYDQAPDVPATWFVDPPYTKQGTHYVESATSLDYSRLGKWCRTRQGQTVVCEGDGAEWLPFEHLLDAAKMTNTNRKNKRSPEYVWIHESSDSVTPNPTNQ